MVEITPEIQAQLDEQKKQCIFCKIIAGEMESHKVYEDDLVFAAFDINPAVKGHMLVMPKEHYPIMPYIPPATFQHMFGLLPKLVHAAQKTMVRTGANVFVANGAAAGQQSPHFLLHILPREIGDGVNLFAFDEEKPLDQDTQAQVTQMLQQNMPVMLRNHFQRVPAPWINEPIPTAAHCVTIKNEQTVVYEDPKVLCTLAKKSLAPGHMVVYAHEQAQDFTKISKETAMHMFYVASYCATAVFEGLQAHGSNIILKTGVSDDNTQGLLELHILPRFQNDGLVLSWQPMKDKPNFVQLVSEMREETFLIEHAQKKPEKKIVIEEEPEEKQPSVQEASDTPPSLDKDEVTRAIDALRRVP